MFEFGIPGRRLLLLVIVALLLTSAAFEAAANGRKGTGWEFAAEPYVWGATLGGTTTTGDDFDIPFSDILENLNIAFMGTVAARKDKWTLFADVIYLDLEGDDRTTATIIKRSVELSVHVEMKGFITTAAAAYAAIESDSTRIDLLAGGRYFRLESSLEFNLGTLKEEASDSGSVIDGIIGLRGRTNLNNDWYFTYYLDVGTGQSEFTWQALGAINYKFESFDLVVGYRYLNWKFDSDQGDILDEVNVHGPVIGAKFSF